MKMISITDLLVALLLASPVAASASSFDTPVHRELATVTHSKDCNARGDSTYGLTVGQYCCDMGAGACENIGAQGSAYVEVGSCRGENACKNAGYQGTFKVAKGTNGMSCKGTVDDVGMCENAAYSPDGQAIIGGEACRFTKACYDVGKQGVASVASFSCNGIGACMGVAANTGAMVSIGLESCGGRGSGILEVCHNVGSFGQVTIGDKSCIGGQRACYGVGSDADSDVVIGDDSCIGDSACKDLSGTINIGDGSCEGDSSCLGLDGPADGITIGKNACACENCCKCLQDGDVIGDGQCTTLGSCETSCCSGADGMTRDGILRGSDYPPECNTDDDEDEYGCRRRMKTTASLKGRQLEETFTAVCESNPNSDVVYKNTLEKKWGITEPTFGYDSQDFALCYGVSDMIQDNMAEYDVFTNDCSTPVTAGALDFAQTMSGNTGDGTGDREQRIDLSIDPSSIVDSNIFTDTGGGATIEFCVRNKLFAGPDEINFLETIVTLVVDLRNCFAIDDISVAPLNKTDESANEDFELRGFLCDDQNNEITEQDGPFNQGDVIRVCVTPNEEAQQNDLYMRYIDSFTFKRDSLTQPAIVGPNEATPIGLTAIDCTAGDLVCAFDTILFASFYASAGSVNGEGSAVMQFGQTSRRLMQGDRRNLQATTDDVMPFDVNLDVALNSDSFESTSGASTQLGVFCFLFTSIVGTGVFFF